MNITENLEANTHFLKYVLQGAHNLIKGRLPIATQKIIHSIEVYPDEYKALCIEILGYTGDDKLIVPLMGYFSEHESELVRNAVSNSVNRLIGLAA